MKILGAVLIIAGCFGVSLGMCRSIRREQRALEELLSALEWMVWELNDQMPPLAQLCRGASEQCGGPVARVLDHLALELEGQVVPDAAACMAAAISSVSSLPPLTAQQLLLLGKNLGRFDLQGQLAGLESAASRCHLCLDNLRADSSTKLRSYQTLGICAGVALVILFL